MMKKFNKPLLAITFLNHLFGIFILMQQRKFRPFHLILFLIAIIGFIFGLTIKDLALDMLLGGSIF